MRPPACVSCKWGTGTTCEKPANSASSKEMKQKLEQMIAERAKQDTKWFTPPTEETTKATKEKLEIPFNSDAYLKLFGHTMSDTTFSETS